MATKLVLTFVDYAGKASSASVLGPDVQTGPEFENVWNVLFNDIAVAIDAVSIGYWWNGPMHIGVYPNPRLNATSPNAQRETKWLVSYADNNDPNGNGSFEIPCADLSLLVPNSDVMDLTTGLGAALKAALDAGMRSKLGNPITVTQVKHVGRTFRNVR